MGAERRRSWRSWRLSLAWVGPCLSPIYCGPQFKPGTEGEEGISRGINRLGTCELLLDANNQAARSVCSPSPLRGGVGGGVVRCFSGGATEFHPRHPPSPTLPHKGGGSRPSVAPAHSTLANQLIPAKRCCWPWSSAS